MLRNTFASFSERNYLFYAIGNFFSHTGMWMYAATIGWSLLEHTGSATQTGVVIALQFGPLFFLSLFGGYIADMFSFRKVLILTQSIFFLITACTAVVIAFGYFNVLFFGVVSLLFGIVRTVDDPSRHAIIAELVPKELLKNAISIRSSSSSLARILGTALAGVIIGLVGVSACFFVISATFFIFILSLTLIHREKSATHRKREGAILLHILEGATAVCANTNIYASLGVAFILGMFAYNFQITLPLLTSHILHAGPEYFSLIFSLFGVGALIGGLHSASKKDITHALIRNNTILMGVTMICMGSISNKVLAALLIVLIGYFGVHATAAANTMIQQNAHENVRGTIMSMWSMLFVGISIIGYPLQGIIGDTLGARAPLIISGIIICISMITWHKQVTKHT